jgi:type II secretory pathway pseudopilin PulG
MNRILVSIALLLLFTACALPESEQLRKENVDLKAQLEAVTQERDALKVQIESIRKALEAPAVTPEAGSSTAPNSSTPNAGTPDSSTPSEVAPANPGSDLGVTPAPAETAPAETAPAETAPAAKTPETPTPEQPVMPQSAAPAMPSTEMGGAAVTTSPLYKYANKVMEAATAFRVQTQQVPPVDCSLGYSAGQNMVERSTQVKRCEVQALENNQYRVRLEGIDGSVVIAP